MTSRTDRASTPPPSPERKAGNTDRDDVMDKLMKDRLSIPMEGLQRIADHKYKCGVYTPMDNFMNTFVWTPLIHLIPKSVAPNMVTLTGFCIQIVGFLVVAAHCPDFIAPAPRWAYGIATLSVFLYQTFDALDGKQARRTGSSSPLGQLFDHGCDSVVTIFLGLLTAMCLHIGFSCRCVLFIFCLLLPFWMCTWSEYHAHVLPTSVAGLIGVTEAQIGSMFICGSNIFDDEFFMQEVGLGSMPSWWCGRTSCPISINDTMIFCQLLVAVFGIAQCFMSVLTSAEDKLGAVLQTLPVWMLAVMGFLWCNLIPHAHPRLVLFSIGVAFSYMTCKMIVAAMSQTDISIFCSLHVATLPVIFGIAYFQLLPRHDDVLLGVYCAVTVTSMSRWVINAMREISHFMGIHAFKIKKNE